MELSAAEKVYSVVTAGAFAEDQWVTSYRLSYSLDVGGGEIQEFPVLNATGGTVFWGNFDRHTAVGHLLETPARAENFFIYPLTSNNAVSLRWGLFKCDEGKTDAV